PSTSPIAGLPTVTGLSAKTHQVHTSSSLRQRTAVIVDAGRPETVTTLRPETITTLANSLAVMKDRFLPLAAAMPALPAVPLLQSTDCWANEEKASTHISSNSDDRNGSRESFEVRYSNDNCSLEVSADGKFTLRADLSDLESISNDGWFRVEERIGRQ